MKRTRSRSRQHRAGRRNPNALYWRVGNHTPWATSPAVLRAHGGSAAAARAAQRKQRRAAKAKRSHAPVARAAAAPVASVVRASAPARTHRRARTRRNPPSSFAAHKANLMGDFKGLGAALADIGKNPKGLLWAGGGALGTVVAGGIVNAQLAKVLPDLSPGTARIINAASYAGTAVLLSRFSKNPIARRQMLAGGLAVALIEAIRPGATAPVVAMIPGVRSLTIPADTAVAVRTPAVQADPQVQAQMVADATPWYKKGGKVNPLNWLSGDDDMAGLGETEPIAVDGIAGPDGQVLRLTDESAPAAVAGDGDDDAPVGDLVQTYLGGLGGSLASHSNGLTKIVMP